MHVDLDANWRNGSGEIDGHCAYVRWNEGVRPLYEAKCYSHELSVSVILKQPDERGMPSTDETSLLHEFEDAIRPHLQAELESVLAMVITCDGSRTFVFYTRDVENAIRRLQSIQPSFVHLQVDVSGRLDPRWTQFNRVAGTGG